MSAHSREPRQPKFGLSRRQKRVLRKAIIAAHSQSMARERAIRHVQANCSWWCQGYFDTIWQQQEDARAAYQVHPAAIAHQPGRVRRRQGERPSGVGAK